MRRALVTVLVVLLLVALDAAFNGFRISNTIYGEVMEFARLVTRTVTQRS